MKRHLDYVYNEHFGYGWLIGVEPYTHSDIFLYTIEFKAADGTKFNRILFEDEFTVEEEV